MTLNPGFLSRVSVWLAAVLLCACGTDTVSAPATPVAQAPSDGSLMSPGRPQIASLPERAVPGVQAITWNMHWGENGRHWAMYVNGKEVRSGDLQAASPQQQQATVQLPLDAPGTYEIKVALCNDHGCSESEPAVMSVTAS